MKLPDSLLGSHFENRFKRGVVFRYLMPDPDDPTIDKRYKYALLINLDPLDTDSFILLTTSRLDKIGGLRQKLPEAYHELIVGSYSWVRKETVINLREPKKYARQSLIDAIKCGTLIFEEELRETDILEVDDKLRRSKTIERKILKKIVKL